MTEARHCYGCGNTPEVFGSCWCSYCHDSISERQRRHIQATTDRYHRAIWFLQDIAAMSRKIGSETAAHALAQLGEPRHRDGV